MVRDDRTRGARRDAPLAVRSRNLGRDAEREDHRQMVAAGLRSAVQFADDQPALEHMVERQERLQLQHQRPGQQPAAAQAAGHTAGELPPERPRNEPLGLLWHHPLAVDDRNDSALLNGLGQLLSAGQLRQFLAGLEVGPEAPF